MGYRRRIVPKLRVVLSGQTMRSTHKSIATDERCIDPRGRSVLRRSLNGPPSVAQRSKIKDCRRTPWKETPPHKCIIYLCHVPVDTWHCAFTVSNLLPLFLLPLSLSLSLSLSLLVFFLSEQSPPFLTPCRPFCFVDDFTRVGHVRKISQTMAGFSSKEDSIAISSRPIGGGQKEISTRPSRSSLSFLRIILNQRASGSPIRQRNVFRGDFQIYWKSSNCWKF